MSDVRAVVYEVVRQVAADEGITLQQLSDSSSLVEEVGLRSLHVARLLAILEVRLGVDPFASGEIGMTSIRTVGDLCAAYAPAGAVPA